MKHRGRYVAFALIVAVIAGLVGARLYLPYWLTDHVNGVLNSIPGHKGSVQNIDVHLYRGAYKIYGLKVLKTGSGIPVPFIDIAETDLSVEWQALFKGRIVSNVAMERPILNFATNRAGSATQTGTEVNWKKYIDKLMPIEINVVELYNGKVTYQDFSANPKVELDIRNLRGELRNLRNVEDKNRALPSTIAVNGTSIGGGKLGIDGRLNVLKKTTDMDMDVRLENVSLPAFNDYARAHAGIDFEKGVISIYSEFGVKNGVVTGYVKPIATDISVVNLEEDSTNPIALIWESLASIVIELFENQPRDQFATKVPISGRVGDVEGNTWSTLAGIFRNAFIEAFTKGTEGEVVFQ